MTVIAFCSTSSIALVSSNVKWLLNKRLTEKLNTSCDLVCWVSNTVSVTEQMLRRLLPPLAVLKERIQVLLFPPTLSSCGPGLGWVGKGVLQAAEYDEGAAAPAFPHWSCNSISDGVRRDLSWGHVHAPNTAWSLSTCLLRAPVPATSASPGSLWETQNLGSHSGSPPPESAF